MRVPQRWRRRLVSLPALLAAAVVMAVVAGVLLNVVKAQSERNAKDAAIDSVHVIGDLVLGPNVSVDRNSDGVLSSDEVANVRADTQVLRTNGRILGLSVWSADGDAQVLDSGSLMQMAVLPQSVVRRAALGQPWAVDRTSATGADSLDVFLPYTDLTDRTQRTVDIVEVLLPQHDVTSRVRSASQLFLGLTAALFVVGLASALLLRRRLHQREHEARHDPLTGLFNRRALLEDGRRRLARAGMGNVVALLVIDLDGFKAVNDTLGHQAGDQLLVAVGRALRSSVRPGDLLARLGGDEFAILVSDLPEDPRSIAEHVLAELRHSAFVVEGITMAVDASIGTAIAPEHGTTVDELLQRADMAMYAAKRGHLGASVWDPASDDRDVTRLALLAELRTALAEDQLVLHFQPQLDLRTGRVVGAEALVRWQHPERGLLFPDAFIPAAESTGLMQPLTRWVLRAAIAQGASWLRAGTPVRVGVNLSPRSLLETDLPTTVLGLLAEAGLPPSLLELEITETAVVSAPDLAADILRRLDTLGIKVSIDDFGTGYTSLSYLKDLPVKALKIDRSLVTDLLDEPADEAITEAVISLGHRLGLTVLAEGVEDEAIRRRLSELGCDEGQGWLWSKALPAPAFEGWLAQQRSARATAGS